jgi:hypothetical protein
MAVTYPFGIAFWYKAHAVSNLSPPSSPRYPFPTGIKFKIPLQECSIKQDLSMLQFRLLLLPLDVLVYYNRLLNP